MEEVEQYIKALREDWEFKKPILEEIRGLNYPFPMEFVDEKTPCIGSIEYEYSWCERPILITMFNATLEQAHEVLRVIRERYNCFWKMDTWETSRRAVFASHLNIGKRRVEVNVHIVNVKDCTWEPMEVTNTQFQMHCS